MKGQCHCGQAEWSLHARPESITACNCTICRRYGALWAYGHIGHTIHTSGKTAAYHRKDGGSISYHFCATCGCLTHYIATKPDAEGKHWTAVNVRMTEPENVFGLPIDHFDGLVGFKDLPQDGRKVSDM